MQHVLLQICQCRAAVQPVSYTHLVARVYVAAAEGHTLEGAAFDGVALTGLTPDVLTQHVEGCRQAENGAYELAGRDYTVRAGYENGQLVLLDMSRNYAVNG